MSDREHFIATLQACYFGDKNALEEIVRIYDEKENVINKIKEYFKDYDETMATSFLQTITHIINVGND